MPVLRKHLIDGRMLPMPCMAELAKLQEQELGTHFEREFPRYSGSGLHEVGELLREQPNCNWRAMVLEGWKRRKYGLNTGTETRSFAYWAAQQGEHQALRRLAEFAGRRDETAQRRIAEVLAHLIPPDANLIDWLRENVDDLAFAEETAKYEFK